MAAGNSVIGALRVDLGLNSAQFTAGLKKAETGLGKFGKAAAIGLGAVAAAATAAGVALGVAVKGAIDHADALSKAAQKAGTSVEALSRLEYAAKLSDVSLEDLTGSLGKLGKAMLETSTNAKSGAAAAFQALGVTVTDASGQLRDSDLVFSDLADRFSRMEDSATKTALAMAVFGKSGAELLPLLNSGADGLKQMADESDRLGLTIDGNSAKAAEGFNDSLTRLQETLRGVTVRVMKAAVPAIENLTEVLSDPKVADAAATFAGWIIDGMTAITQAATATVNVISSIKSALEGTDIKATPYTAADLNNANRDLGFGLRQLQYGKPNATDLYSGFTFGKDGTIDRVKKKPPGNKSNGPDLSNWGGDGSGSGDKSLADYEEIDAYAKAMEGLSGVLEKQHSPFLSLKQDLTDLDILHEAGKINAETYGNAVVRTYANVASAALDMAGSVTGTLSNLFKDNKAFAAANAVVQGLSGVANALGSAPPPINFINAGLVAAASAANLANILSANESTTSMPGTVTPGATGAAPQSSAINLTVRGSGMISVDDLADQLAQSISDGGNSNLITVMRAAI